MTAAAGKQKKPSRYRDLWSIEATRHNEGADVIHIRRLDHRPTHGVPDGLVEAFRQTFVRLLARIEADDQPLGPLRADAHVIEDVPVEVVDRRQFMLFFDDDE